MSTASVPAARSAELHDIPGPTAFGEGWRRTWDLLWLTSVTEFRVQYSQTALGYAWSVLKPFAFFGIIYAVISQVLRVADRVSDYPHKLILALVFFQYFSEATSVAMRSISAREAMVRKAQFPRIVIPLSASMSSAITLFFNLVGVLLLLLVTGVEPQVYWLLMPVAIIALLGFTTMLSILLSVAYVRAEDVGQAWSLTLRALFYATPILYTLVLIPAGFRPVIAANPLTPIIEYARIWVIDPNAPTPVDLVGVVPGLVVPGAIAVAVAVTGFFWFKRDAPRVAEAL